MVELTVYAGLAGDRNCRGMAGAIGLGALLGQTIDVAARTVGAPTAPVPGGWADQLRAARPGLRRLAAAIDAILAAGRRPLTTMGRCAAALATLPVIARYHPDAAIVWFDAHGDSNLPAGRPDGSYLGGMVLTGAAGGWDTDLGSGLDLANVVLVGSRDLDPAERELVRRGTLALVEAGPELPARLRRAVAGRAVYVHIDCDVLDPGLVPTEYQVPGGLTLDDLAAACAALAEGELIGIEIAEFESVPSEGQPVGAVELVTALGPLLQALR